MQSKIIAGDSLSWPDAWPDYPASAGWVQKTRLVPRATGGTAITLTATAEGDGFRTVASATTTAPWSPGSYAYTKWVEKSGERATVDSGTLEILPDPATMAAGTDTRNHVERALANIEAMLEGKASKDVQEYTIGDRQLKHYSIAELLLWRDKYKAQLAVEKGGKRLGLGRRIYTRIS